MRSKSDFRHTRCRGYPKTETNTLIPAVSKRSIRTLAVVFAALVSGCGSLGDTGSIKEATSLAVACRTDEALRALDKAERGGGLGKYLAGLERVGILRDAGRDTEAADALETYRAREESRYTSDEEIESSLENFVAELREKRRDKTGSSVCAR